jgi:catechol 2,3-dioxygenase-like lactoylglutathione lyase family enzyme
MFADRQATMMIPATDLDRAIAWYRDKLGLEPVSRNDAGANYSLAGGMPMFLYKSAYAGTAKHTLVTFDSPDLKADMAGMRARGVVFNDYDLPGLKTQDGIADFGTVKNAWAVDSEGNILGFVEGMPAVRLDQSSEANG